jgi:DHA2 family multidrug resistance protein-like MFS transporter
VATVAVQGNVLVVSIPYLTDVFAVSPAAASIPIVAYQATLTVAILPMAKIAEEHGILLVLQTGLMMILASSLFAFFWNSFEIICACRIVQGLGAAAVMSVVSTLVKTIYSSANLGRGLSLNSVVAATCGITSPLLGGILISLVEWRWLMITGLPFALLCLALTRKLPLCEAGGGKIAYLDMGLYVALSLVVAFMFLSVKWLDIKDIMLFSFTITMAILSFISYQNKQKDPFVPISLLLSRDFIWLNLATFLISSSFIIFIMTQSFFLYHRGYTSFESGLLIGLFSVSNIIFRMIVSEFSDAVNHKSINLIASIIILIGIALFGLTRVQNSLVLIVLSLFLTGCGFAALTALNSRVLIANAPLRSSPSASGLIGTIRQSGYTIGSTLFSALLAFPIIISPLLFSALLIFAAAVVLVGPGQRSANS